jgi:hypothetical protein
MNIVERKQPDRSADWNIIGQRLLESQDRALKEFEDQWRNEMLAKGRECIQQTAAKGRPVADFKPIKTIMK